MQRARAITNARFLKVPGTTNSFYWSQRLSVGAYVDEKKCMTLADSGLDERTAKQIYKAAEAEGWTIGAIINSHGHADHCGGNAYFQKKYPNIKIVSTKHEKHFIEDPHNEPSCFCKGAAPMAGLRNKFLEAQPSRVTQTIEPYEDQELEINGSKFKIITLPGHTPGMIGVVSPDNVFYTGDAIFGNETLEKHGVLFYTDIEKTLDSFKKIAKLEVDSVVFYHGGLMEGASLQEVVAKHEERILATKQAVLEIIAAEPVSMNTLTQRIMQKFYVPSNFMQFTLTETCMHAYVAYLESKKEISVSMHDCMAMYASPSASESRISRAAHVEKSIAVTPPVHDESEDKPSQRVSLSN